MDLLKLYSELQWVSLARLMNSSWEMREEKFLYPAEDFLPEHIWQPFFSDKWFVGVTEIPCSGKQLLHACENSRILLYHIYIYPHEVFWLFVQTYFFQVFFYLYFF